MTRNTRERLVEAALALFADKGYRSTTVQEIAAKAGTNVAAINYHFRSKANFYAEVVLSASEFADASYTQVAPTADNAEQLLYEFLDHQLRELHEKRDGSLITQIRAQEMAEPSPVLEIIAERLVRPIIVHVEGIVGTLLPDDADSETVRRHTTSILGQIHIYKMGKPILGLIYPDVVMDEPELDRLREHIFRGVMSAITAEHGARTAGDDHVVA